MIKKIIFTLSYVFFFSHFSYSQIFEKQIYQIERDANYSAFIADNGNYRSDTNINVNHYKLFLNITYNPHYLKGAVTIKSTSLVNNLSSVFYDLADTMTVDSVRSGNVSLNFSHSENKVLISLNSSLNTGQEFTVTIYYRGVPIPTGLGSFVFGSHGNNEPAIWTLSEPFGSSDWFPCKNVPFDKADSSDVWIQCSDSLIAASNGVLTETVNNNDGTHTFKWHNSYPIVNYVISLAISNYAQYNFYYKYSQNDSMPVLNYIYPENLEKLKPQLDKTNYMLDLFSQKFGLYPFINEKYGHAEFGRIAGMEHQTISSMGAFFDDILAHELVHQWFGDKITCLDWQNIWLNEGFATYGEAIYNESAFGQEAYKDFIKFRMTYAKTAIGSIYVQDVKSINEIFSGNRSYAKGCVVLHMLRGVVGDSAFFNILKSYATNPSISYKNAVTEDFKLVAESFYGSSLNYFFDEWIYGENYPKYNVGWSYVPLNQTQYKVTINVTQDVNINPAFFTMPVQIKIITQGGDSLVTVYNDSQSQNFEFTVNSKPLNFKFDPNNLILKDVRGENIVPVKYSLSQNYPNPFNPDTKISYELGKPSNVTLTICNILGQIIGTYKSESQREGSYTLQVNLNGFASGAYFYILEARDLDNSDLYFSEAKEMMYIK